MTRSILRAAALALASGCATGGGRIYDLKLNDQVESVMKVAETLKHGDSLQVAQQKTTSLGEPTLQNEDFCNSLGCVRDVHEGANFKNALWVKENEAGKPPITFLARLKFCLQGWVVETVTVTVDSGKKDGWGKDQPPYTLYEKHFLYLGCTD